MIPLSQYLADGADDEFTPLMALAARKAQMASGSNTRMRPLKVLPKPAEAVRVPAAPQAHPVPAFPSVHSAAAASAPRLVTEPRVPLRDLEAERAARAAERQAQETALAEAVEAARAEGIETGRALAAAEAEAAVAERIAGLRGELEGEHATALLDMRARWTSEQADRLADLLILQMAILEESMKLSFGSVLRPLALDARRRQAIDEVAGAVKTIAFDGSAYRIAASGPADLLGALEAKLGEEARLVSFAPDETKTDIRIDADATVIESRLSSWRSALEEALA